MKKEILYSPDFGAGFWTWNKKYTSVITDTFIIGKVKEGKFEEIKLYLKEKYDGNFYDGGVDGLKIYELEEGEKFSIEEFDGSESIIIEEDLIFTA